jgi:hypothetical protein
MEKENFIRRLQEVQGNTLMPPQECGVFAMGIPGRAGYQCQHFYEVLSESGDLMVLDSRDTPACTNLVPISSPVPHFHTDEVTTLTLPAVNVSGSSDIGVLRLTDKEMVEIIQLHQGGHNWRDIGTALGRSAGACCNFFHRWEKDHLLRHKLGRPKEFGETATQMVIRTTVENRRSTVIEVAKATQMSSETARQIRHSNGYHYFHCVPVPRLTIEAKMKRVAFSLEQVARGDDIPIIFTDESMVAQDLNVGCIWRKRGEILEEGFYEHDHHPISVMVWGAIGVGFHGPLIRCPAAVNQTSYREILACSQIFETLTARFGQQGFWWQQDNAPPHQPVKREIGQIYKVLNWPPYSPDLSPIEQMWAIIKRRLKGRRFANGDELFDALSREWADIYPEAINNLCSSFKSRCEVCAKHEGASLNGYWPEVRCAHHQCGSTI